MIDLLGFGCCKRNPGFLPGRIDGGSQSTDPFFIVQTRANRIFQIIEL